MRTNQTRIKEGEEMNVDMMNFLTDEQITKVQAEIVEKMIKGIQECDFDIKPILGKEIESIIELSFEECDLSPVQDLISDFLIKKISKSLE